MGMDPDAALGAVRLSLGHATTPEHVTLAAQALVRAFRGQAPGHAPV
jgi:cysteine sulfinate desulfinase/cysteine desulfurase-like protein